ncbi:hypothetical protein AB0K66_04540 [Streptomyces werraensis]|uniref:hypothetical protein n=1 Tax=Streptomyces werraensis TaxID=68284 RepID=UPI00343588D5
MSHRSAGPACGNNPHHRMSDGDRQAVDAFRAYLATVHRLDRIRDAARLHRQQLLGTSELYAVIEADDEPEPAAVSAAVAPPGDRAALRERIAEETALSLGRDLLREGLGAFLLRLVGPENARRVLAEAAAVAAAVAPPTTPAADEAALAPLKAKAREVEARRLATHRAAVLREAADALDAGMERFFSEWPDEPRNSPYALGQRDAANELRRMADETATETPAEVIHACPPDGSGLTPCCGRTPFELPRTDRISSEAPTTCTEPAAGARQDGAQP